MSAENPIQQLVNNEDDDNMNIMPDISNLVEESPNVLPMTTQNDLSNLNGNVDKKQGVSPQDSGQNA